MQDHIKAGNIAKQALLYGKGLIKKRRKSPGCHWKDREEDLRAWSSSCISCAAELRWYRCAFKDDPTILGQLVCLDVGAHVNGCIGDNALTLDLW